MASNSTLLSDNTRWAAMGNMASQIFGMAGQLVFIPVYLNNWGASSYGIWMICVGFTAYAAILDFGVSQAASNEVISALAKSDRAYASFWVGLAFRVTLAMALLALILAALIYPYAINFIKQTLGGKEYSTVLYVCVVVQLVLLIVFNTFICMLRASGGNATSAWIAAICIAAETSLPAIIAVNGGGLGEAAIGFVLPRFLCVMVAGIIVFIASPWITYFKFNWKCLNQAKKIWFPSVANLLLPGGVALLLQGTLAAVGALFGTQSAATFGIARTLSRLPFQISYVFVRTSFPAITKAAALADNVKLNSIYRHLVKVFLYITVPLFFGYLMLSKTFLEMWTNSGMQFDFSLIFFITCSSLIHALWHFLVAPLMASNQHSAFAFRFFILVCIALIVAKYAISLNFFLLIIIFMEVCILLNAIFELKFKFKFKFKFI